MRHLAAVLLLIATSAAMAASSVCLRDCARMGYDYAYCASYCDRDSGADTSLPIQQGTPTNPGFDAIPDPVPKRRPAYPANVDTRCFADCQSRGYQYRYCQNYCSY
jgi:hypothetical protein